MRALAIVTASSSWSRYTVLHPYSASLHPSGEMVPSKWALAKPFPIQGVGDKEEIFSQLFHVTKIERSSGSIDHLVRYKLNLKFRTLFI